MQLGARQCGRAILGAFAILLAALPARAATLIRDGEIEETLHRIADPIFAAARLEKDAVSIYVLRDDALNAFVAGGQNLFLNTGLIIRTENPDQLGGVIAHETGHIAGGHLSRSVGARETATVESILGAVLGAAAAVAGAPQVGTAIMAGGATVAQSGLLAFSRGQEESADQAAVGFLNTTGRSPQGLIDFFHILDNQNLHISANGSPFLRTHPLTPDRIKFLETRVAASPYREARPDPALVEAHARMVAKLDGFLGDPMAVIRRRAGNGLPDRYARAVAYYRVPDLDKSLGLIDGLIAEKPEDPWFQELKGQVLFENGRIAQAEAPYRAAVRLKPSAPLLRLGLARTLMEQGGEARLQEAVPLLKEVVRIEPDNGGAWRFLGVAQGGLGQEGEAELSLAEASVQAGKKRDAELHVRRAQDLIQPDSPSWYQVQDVSRTVADMRDERLPPRRP